MEGFSNAASVTAAPPAPATLRTGSTSSATFPARAANLGRPARQASSGHPAPLRPAFDLRV